jgi:hypothetical protein
MTGRESRTVVITGHAICDRSQKSGHRGQKIEDRIQGPGDRRNWGLSQAEFGKNLGGISSDGLSMHRK